ncbi:hypothetical protein [Pseudomonas sp. AIG]
MAAAKKQWSDVEVRWIENETGFHKAQCDIIYVNIAAFMAAVRGSTFECAGVSFSSQVFHTCVQLPPFMWK